MIYFVLVVLAFIAIIGAFCIPSADASEARWMGAILSIICVSLMALIVLQ